MNLLPVTSTLIEPLLLRVIAERWRKERCESEEAHAAVRELLEGGAAKRIQIGYRQTTEPPGVEVWVYRGEGHYGAPGASPLGAILAVGFAKWQGPHTVHVRSKKFIEIDGKKFHLTEKRTAGDKYDLQRGLIIAFGRAIRQALDELVAQRNAVFDESLDRAGLRTNMVAAARSSAPMMVV